ncbi:MAG TPA: hypothetical protein VFA92_08995 [Candidatus Binatia bacterium]|nr:hypothetical protein [Candidatus Binatia bacterium]
MSTSARTVEVAGGHVVAGNIAARIDRLPLIWVQYLLAAVTQIYWGIIIDADGFISRIYPFVWQPLGMTVVEFSVILASNIGAASSSASTLAATCRTASAAARSCSRRRSSWAG